MIAVRSILGFASVPSHRTTASEWLERHLIPVFKEVYSGGFKEKVRLTDLPSDVQLAYRLRVAAEAGLTFGEQNDAAHVELQAKPMGVQETADARAGILAFIHRHQEAGLAWPQIAAQLKGAGFFEGPSYKTVKRWFEMVSNVDPANWAPALGGCRSWFSG